MFCLLDACFSLRFWCADLTIIINWEYLRYMIMWMSTKVDITLTTTCSQGLTFYMPVVSRDLSSHSWGSIAIGQHHAIGQVRKHIALIHRCLQILVNCPNSWHFCTGEGRKSSGAGAKWIWQTWPWRWWKYNQQYWCEYSPCNSMFKVNIIPSGTGDASKATEVTGVNGCTEVRREQISWFCFF